MVYKTPFEKYQEEQQKLSDEKLKAFDNKTKERPQLKWAHEILDQMEKHPRDMNPSPLLEEWMKKELKID